MPALPHLIEHQGLVVNMGSVASRNVFPNSGVYCATKHAVLALGEAIRQDLKGQGGQRPQSVQGLSIPPLSNRPKTTRIAGPVPPGVQEGHAA